MATHGGIERMQGETERFASIADLGGAHPRLAAFHAAVIALIGSDILLRLFAGLTRASDGAYWLADGTACALGAAAAGVQWWRARAWRQRYNKAQLDEMKFRAMCEAEGKER